MSKDRKKQLVLVRHAKSSWKEFGLKDFDRPLNPRGKRDAPFMAMKFKENFFIPQAIISSPAKRAHQTAEIFTEAFGIDKDKISLEADLYHAEPEAIEEQVNIIDDEIESIMLFAHNPGLTIMANMYTDQLIDNVPTTGLFILQAKSNTWLDFFKSATLSNFIYPKMYQ